MGMDDGDEVAQASQLLTVMLHCRRQARELQACTSGRCERERAAFATCAEEHVYAVIGHLAKIADANCQAEVERYRQCRTHTPGATCEEEDLAAIRCASRHVLESARAPPAG